MDKSKTEDDDSADDFVDPISKNKLKLKGENPKVNQKVKCSHHNLGSKELSAKM